MINTEIRFGFETAFEREIDPFISIAALSQPPIRPGLSNLSVEDRSEKVYTVVYVPFIKLLGETSVVTRMRRRYA